MGPGERKGTGTDIHLPRKLGHRHPRGLLLGLGEFDHEVHFARGTTIYDFNQSTMSSTAPTS